MTISPICSTLVNAWRRVASYDVKCLQLPLTVVSCFWAILLAPRIDLQSDVYTVLRDVAPEWLWSLILAAIGGMHLVGFLANSRRAQRIALCCSTAVWLFIGALFFLSALFAHGSAPTGGVYIIFGAMAWWALAKNGT